MTEAEWLSETDPARMLVFQRGKVSDRKVRLLGVAIARASLDRLGDDRSRRAVEVTEAFADGLVDVAALQAAANEAWDVRDEMWDAGPADFDDRG